MRELEDLAKRKRPPGAFSIVSEMSITLKTAEL